jgi:hypothetical protein
MDLRFNIATRPQVDDILQKNIFNRLSFYTLYLNSQEYDIAYSKLNNLKFESNDLTGWDGIDNYVSTSRYIPKAECSYFDESVESLDSNFKLFNSL